MYLHPWDERERIELLCHVNTSGWMDVMIIINSGYYIILLESIVRVNLIALMVSIITTYNDNLSHRFP